MRTPEVVWQRRAWIYQVTTREEIKFIFFSYGFDDQLRYTFRTRIKTTLSRNPGPLIQLT